MPALTGHLDPRSGSGMTDVLLLGMMGMMGGGGEGGLWVINFD